MTWPGRHGPATSGDTEWWKLGPARSLARVERGMDRYAGQTATGSTAVFVETSLRLRTAYTPIANSAA